MREFNVQFKTAPDRNDVGEEKQEAEEISIPGPTEAFKAHHYDSEYHYCHEEYLQE